MQICVFASSSAGNCTLVRSGRTAILIDCGLPPARLSGLLEGCGIALGELAGVLVTHTHGDHLHGGMLGALRDSRVPLFCAGSVANAIGGQLELFGRDRLPAMKLLEGTPRRIGALDVHSFPVPHDAPGGCFGFVIHRRGRTDGTTMVLATDIGHVERELADVLSGADLAIVESNHDLGMLMGSGRPEWLIHRIRTRGHLSNDETASLLEEALRRPRARLRQIVLAHLSEQCNRPMLALSSARRATGDFESQRVRISCAPPRLPLPPIEI